MPQKTKTPSAPMPGPVSAAVLIDGDNDPHLPKDLEITPDTLVRIFLRPGASIPRALDRRIGAIPMKTAVLSQEGGKNAADFVMALHAGLLHATLPMQVPFTLVTADKKLGAIVEELSRIGRRAVLWTSHPDRSSRGGASKPRAAQTRRSGGSRKTKPPASAGNTAAPRSRRSRRAKAAAPDPELAKAARAYAERLSRVKDPPGRLKTLLNDIKNRAGLKDVSPEAVVEELKRLGKISVDAEGRVKKS